MATRGCLTCKFFEVDAPRDWTPSYDGDEYDAFRVRNRIQETGKHVQGRCHFYPSPIAKWSGDWCGQRQPIGWVRSEMTDRKFIWGERSRVDQLEQQVTDLKKQLAASRKLSAGRLARLQQPIPNGKDHDEHPDGI